MGFTHISHCKNSVEKRYPYQYIRILKVEVHLMNDLGETEGQHNSTIALGSLAAYGEKIHRTVVERTRLESHHSNQNIILKLLGLNF